MFAAVLAAAPAEDTLRGVAREFSPRIEAHGAREVTLDVAGLSRLFESPRVLGEELRRAMADRGLQVRVAVAPTRTTARLLVRARAGLAVVDEAGRAAALAALPIETLASLASSDARDDVGRESAVGGRLGPPVDGRATATSRAHSRPATDGRLSSTTHGPGRPTTHDHQPPARIADLVATLRRWGVRTLGELVALPPAALSERLGQDGIAWQRLARGEDAVPLVPLGPDERFEAAMDLEWPIEALEPLAFVVGRLLDELCVQLEARHRAAAAMAVDLRLVTREVHAHRLELPQPMRDARALRTVAMLYLESHPAPAAIDRVAVRLEPAPARTLQHALFTRPEPAPEQIATLLARVTAVMGEGRVGSPATVDSWRPGSFEMRPFGPPRNAECGVRSAESFGLPNADLGMNVEFRNHAARGNPQSATLRAPQSALRIALRRFRLPVPARVDVQSHRPVHVATDRRGVATGRVTACAGPWRTSGCWWTVDADPAVGGRRLAVDGKDRAPQARTVNSPLPDPSARQRVEGPTAHRRGDSGPFDRDEWDVALTDGAVYRLFRDRQADTWFVEGCYD